MRERLTEKKRDKNYGQNKICHITIESLQPRDLKIS